MDGLLCEYFIFLLIDCHTFRSYLPTSISVLYFFYVYHQIQIKYVGISHFTLYYNGVISESRNVASLLDRIQREQRRVVVVEWNQPYKRLLNSTSVTEG